MKCDSPDCELDAMNNYNYCSSHYFILYGYIPGRLGRNGIKDRKRYGLRLGSRYGARLNNRFGTNMGYYVNVKREMEFKAWNLKDSTLRVNNLTLTNKELRLLVKSNKIKKRRI